MIKDKLILVDWDSTILSTSETIVELFNSKNRDKPLIYTPEHDWNFYPIVKTKEELKELFTYFDDKDFYNNPILIDGTVEVINRLIDRGYIVKVLSKHEEQRKALTREYIEYLFNGKVQIEFVSDFKDKIAYESFCIIDDKVECLEGSRTKYKICFGDYQWNKDYMGIKAYDWNEVESLIKYFEECERCF